MGVEKEQIKEILPIGDQLRAMISQSFLTGKHLRDLLSSKGVFIDENDKNKSVPLLMNTILSPKEFLKLVESQKTKEEKFKVNTLTLPCKTDKALLDIIPANFSINKIIKENIVYKPNYKVKANPQFTYVGKDKKSIQLEYEIERENRTKDWVNTKTTHKTLITIEKKANNEISLVLTKSYTSKETNDINEMVLRNLKGHFKNANIVKEEVDFVRILFKDFTNQNRIQFLYSFTSPALSRHLEFVEITDLNVHIDPDVDTPNEIKEFITGIDKLKINGKELQEHIFITKNDYHEKIVFSSISLKYKFNFNGIEGNCIVEYSFPAYLFKQRTNAEFQFDIVINVNRKVKEFANTSELHKNISKIIENQKLEQFEKYKKTVE